MFGIDRDRRLDQLYHTAWTTKDGAPGAVQALAQTTDGYLWLGTANGLFRFDGVYFEHYQPVTGPPLPSAHIHALFAVPDGGLWIGSSSGDVSLLKNGILTNYGVNDGMPHGFVWSFARDRQGKMFVASSQGLLQLKGSKWERMGADWNYAESALSLLVDSQGTLWVGLSGSVRFLPEGETRFHLAASGSRYVKSLARSPDGKVWMADFGNGVKPVPVPPDDPRAARPMIDVASNAVLFDDQGSLWVTSLGDGIRRVPYPEKLGGKKIGRLSSDAEIFTQKQGLTGDAILCILQDREGNVWTGTNIGLDRFRQSPVVSVEFPPGTVDFVLKAEENGKIRVAAANRSLMLIDKGKAIEIPGEFAAFDGYRIPGGFAAIASYVPDPIDHQKYIADTKTVLETPYHSRLIHRGKIFAYPHTYFPGSGSFRDAFAGTAEMLNAVTRDSSGRVWFAVRTSGAIRVGANHSTSLKDLGGPSGAVSSAFTDASGRVWFGFHNRVAVLDGDVVRTFSANDGISVGDVASIHGKGQKIWIGGPDGLALFDGSRFRMMQPAASSGYGGIREVVATADEGLWLSSDLGVVHIPNSEVESFQNNLNYRVQFQIFDAEDGLSAAPQSPGYGSAAEGTDGLVYFATMRGVVWIDPKRISKNELPPPVSVDSLIANGTKYVFSELVNLPARTTSLQIHYAALSLSIPERVRFRYKLDGGDMAWQDVGTRRDAYYTNLGPGTYTFHVVACNNDGVWNHTGATATFVIAPAYYQTWWFRLSYGAIAAGALWMLYLYRLKRATAEIQERLGARLEERERIARELHDTLLQGFQGLVLRLQAVLKALPAEAPAHQMIEKVLDRADDVLLEGRQSVRDLRQAGEAGNELAEALKNSGEELALGNSTVFSLTVIGTPQSMGPVVFNEVCRIAREAFANAFQHAQAKKIEVELTYTSVGVSLSVRDDGTGIDAAILNKGRQGHWGLSGMRERAQKIGGKLNIQSNPGGGTGIELTIPARVAYPQSADGSRWQRIKRFVTRANKGASQP